MKWPQVRLADVCSLITDGTHYTPPDVGAGVSFLTVKDMTPAGLDFQSASKISRDEYKRAASGNSAPAVGDVLYSKDGSVGKVHVVSEDVEFAVLSSIAILRPDSNKIDSAYLGKVLDTNIVLNQAVKKKTGSAIRRIILGDLKQVLLPLPPLEEQKRIAAILDKADAIRRKRQQAIELADQFLRSVFLDMFGDPITNPKGWELVEINNLCTDIVDCVNRTAPIVEVETPYKMIRTTNVRNMKIDVINTRYVESSTYDHWVRRLKPQIGDIIFTREAPAGEAGIVRTEDKIFLGQRTMHFRPDMELSTPEFLLFELMGAGVKRQIDQMSAGSTVTHLSVPECKKFLIRRPSLDVQRKFTNLVVNIDSRVNRLKATQVMLSKLFNSLTQRAFSGELTGTKAA